MKKQLLAPQVSVLMGVYNEPVHMLKESVYSILNQTFDDFEFIIIIDNLEASEQIEFIEKTAERDKRIRIIKNAANMGLAKTLNVGIELARGIYLARMDADDISVSNRLEIEVAYMDSHGDCDLVYCLKENIDENGNVLKGKIIAPKNDMCLAKSLQFGSLIVHPSVLMRADKIREIGGYHEYYAAQDYDLWLRMAKAGYRLHCIEKRLLYYRLRSDSISFSKFELQCISAEYARYLSKNNKKFDKNEYTEFVKFKQEDKKFMVGTRCFLEVCNGSPIKRLLALIKCIFTDYCCIQRVMGSLIMKKYIIELRVFEN